MELVPAEFVTLDERFAACGGDANLERLCTGCRWTEGPVYFAAGRYLLFSDIPNDRMLRWDETDDSVSVFRSPAGYTNGHTIDRHGRLVSCEQGGRRVTRTEYDGRVTVLADRCDGKRFNSPNDVVVRGDGSIWFTDPPYGILTDYEGERAEPETDGCHVYRLDPADGSVRVVADDFERPNGLAFSVDERRLFVADTHRNHIRVFDVTDDGGLSGGDVFAKGEAGRFDGLRVDTAGRVWAAAADVHCYDPDGTLIGKLLIPEPAVSNLVFGGSKRNRLFVTATASVYSILLRANGAWRP